MKAVRMNNKGFSLVELMIVVAIIGILATIAVPNFQRFQAKAKQTEGKAALSAIYTAEKSFFAEWSQYYGRFADIGYVPEGKANYHAGFSNTNGQPAAPFQAARAGSLGYNIISSTACTLALCPGFSPTASAAGAGNITGAAVANDTFTASARSKLGQQALVDVWTMDQNKLITNTTPGI